MISLRSFTYKDTSSLKRYYSMDMTTTEIESMIDDWNTKTFDGKYSEFFAITSGVNVVGVISLYQHSENVIGIGPEVFKPYQRQGIGKAAMLLAMNKAKSKGYKIVSQIIRTNNIASIALHESLGFETDSYRFINRHGNEIYIYLKLLV